jgi:hypothetical protein
MPRKLFNAARHNPLRETPVSLARSFREACSFGGSLTTNFPDNAVGIQ